jgi:5'-hydroxyaverantin dehydrogenase
MFLKHDNTYSRSILTTSSFRRALFHHTDVTSFSSQQAAFRHALDWSPSKNIDIVIANAGVAGGSILSSVLSSSSTHNTLPAPNTAAIDVNVNGTYHTAVLALQNFAKYSDSQLIFIGSMASYIVEPTALAAQYTSSKFFVRGLFKSLRFATVFQLGYGLRCNLIVPAWVDTKMIDTSSGALNSQKVKVAAVEDVVAVTMRVMCDETIRGRSVGVVPGGASAQQSGFDMEDDPRGRDGGRVIWQVIGGGSVFGEVVKKVLEFTSWFKA